MAAITDVTLTAGVPTAGTGTVTTLDKYDGAAGTPTARALTIQGNSGGTPVPVSLASVPSHAVTNAGTFAVQVSSAPSTAVTNAGTFAVQNSSATPTGTNVIGRVGIDQTTPGTTNLVALAANQSINNAQIAGNTISTGSGAMGTGTQRVALATDSPGIIATGTPGALGTSGISATVINPSNYETVAASQTAQALGATGATGDFINGLLVVPATTSPGNVLLLDNATSITVFTGGATSVSNLVPFFIPLGMTSVSGAWKVTTGSNVSVIGIGKFT